MDPLAEKHRREFDELRSSRTRLLKMGTVAVALMLIGFFLLFGPESSHVSGEITDARRELLQIDSDWADEMLAQHDNFSGWLDRHGLSLERALFARVSLKILLSAVSLADTSPGGNPGFFRRAYISLHLAFVRVLFIVVAGFRLWVFVTLLAFLWSSKRFHVYQGKDLLGETGNGRMFYSGIRVGLDEIDDRGVPSFQVTGLACPAAVSPTQARTSAIGKVLSHFGSLNETNAALAGIILAHNEYPAFVATREESALLGKAFADSQLPRYVPDLLVNVLELHREYSEDRGIRGAAPKVLATLPASDGAPVSPDVYAAQVQHALHRVVTPMLRKELGTLSAKQVATAALAMEAGKVLTYAREANRWVRRSSFHQLNARAVLHSVAAFHSEYTLLEREEIRRSLVYASRSSVFAPVRFPTNLSARASALRQWTEVLLSCPHELQSSADEIELFGLVSELHQRWSQRFIDSVLTAPPQGFEDVFLTTSNLLFMPVYRLLEQFHMILEPTALKRLEELVTVVYQKQKIHSLTLDASRDSGEGTVVEGYTGERFLGPLGSHDIAQIAERHGLRVDEVRAWSVIRVILNSQAWLARRVGDYSVPLSSLIFAVFEPLGGGFDLNAKGLMGRKAMVPLRTSKLSDRFGRGWQRHFIEVQRATMAETKEDFERRLNDIEDRPSDIGEDGSAAG